jgi:hypothetical protein
VNTKAVNMKPKINFLNLISSIFLILLIAVLVSNIAIGGDAISGKIENGKYFVWDANHKTNAQGEKLYLEVARNTFYFNLGLTYLFLFTLPFFLYYRIRHVLICTRNKKANATIKQ